MSDDSWRYQEWADRNAPAAFAQRLGIRIQDDGLDLNWEEGRTSLKVQYMDLVQMFADCAQAAVDEHIRRQREKAEYIDAHEGQSGSPEDRSETPHRISAQSIIVHFMNGADEIIHCHHPMVQNGGWTFRELNGIPYLVIGHGVPRRQYPLCNIRFIELSPEVL